MVAARSLRGLLLPPFASGCDIRQRWNAIETSSVCPSAYAPKAVRKNYFSNLDDDDGARVFLPLVS